MNKSILLIFLALFSIPAVAQHTYDFQFEKASSDAIDMAELEKELDLNSSATTAITPAPTDTGKSSEIAEMEKELDLSPPGKSRLQVLTRKNENFHPWHMSVGATKFRQLTNWHTGSEKSEYRGFTLQFGRRITPKIGFESEVSIGTGHKAMPDDSYASQSDAFKAQSRVFSTAISITPYMLDVFGYTALEFSGLIGGSYLELYGKAAPYLEARASAAINPRYSIVAYGRRYVAKDLASYLDTIDYKYEPQDMTGILFSLHF